MGISWHRPGPASSGRDARRQAGVLRYACLLFFLATLFTGLSADLCQAQAASRTPEPVGPGIKWNPGHYMLLYLNHSKQQLEDIRDEPYVQGAQIRYRWAELEPEKGVYDFSEIEADLRRLSAMSTPKRLVIQVLDRRFHTDDPYEAAPRYIVEDPAYGVSRTKNGYIANLWQDSVTDRLIELYRALAERFDAHPYLEAVANSESAPGFGERDPPEGFSRPALARQIKRLMDEAQRAFIQTNVILFVNSLAGEIEGLVGHCISTRGAIGGPDVKPARPTQAARYLIDRQLQGVVPIMFAVQSPNLGPEAHRNTPAEIYNYAINELGASHVFWIRFGDERDSATQRFSWQEGILPVIRENAGRTRGSCPQTLQGRCVIR